MLRASGVDIGLVIAGGKGWLDDPIYASIRDHHVEDAVQLIGYADDTDLPVLYSDAMCVAMPSLYEGFGLPILEAFQCGIPVVTANVSSLPEVAGDAALMVDPYDQEALAYAIHRLASDEALRADLTRRGLERAKQFTWESSARNLYEVYARVIGIRL